MEIKCVKAVMSKPAKIQTVEYIKQLGVQCPKWKNPGERLYLKMSILSSYNKDAVFGNLSDKVILKQN